MDLKYYHFPVGCEYLVLVFNQYSGSGSFSHRIEISEFWEFLNQKGKTTSMDPALTSLFGPLHFISLDMLHWIQSASLKEQNDLVKWFVMDRFMKSIYPN